MQSASIALAGKSERYEAAEYCATAKRPDSIAPRRFSGATPSAPIPRSAAPISGFDVEHYKKARSGQVVQAGGDWRSGMRKERQTGRTTSPGTINSELANLPHLFERAIEWKWITTAKPALKRMKEGEGRIEYLSESQRTG